LSHGDGHHRDDDGNEQKDEHHEFLEAHILPRSTPQGVNRFLDVSGARVDQQRPGGIRDASQNPSHDDEADAVTDAVLVNLLA